MGSYGNAIMVGFVCRICSQQKKNVIHLYSSKASSLQLLEKMKYLPIITVEKFDNLPKTICENCIERLEVQYKIVQRLQNHRMSHNNGKCPVECPLYEVQITKWFEDNEASVSNV